LSSLLDKFQAYFPLVSAQLNSYLDRMEKSASTEDEEKDSMKQLIIDTRNALRFGLSCFSVFPVNGKDETTNDVDNAEIEKTARQALQHQAISNHWHVCLCRLLSRNPTKGRSNSDDMKCRLYAARLLSNIATRNFTAATAVVSTVSLSPTQASIQSRIQQETMITISPTPTTSSCDDPATITSNNRSGSNWLDMLLGAAKCPDRNVLAAVVAALHSCIASLSSSATTSATRMNILSNDDEAGDSNITNRNRNMDDDDDDDDLTHHPIEPNSSPFHEQVATDQLIVAALLRQVISTNETIRNNNPTATASSAEKMETKDAQISNVVSCADVATEWILMLLLQLFRLGLLPQLYGAAGGGSGDGTAAAATALDVGDEVIAIIVPEQVVLLHCLIKGIEDESEKNAMATSGGGGGDGDVCSIIFGDNPNHAVGAHLFLARVYINARRGLVSSLSSSESDDDDAYCPRHWWLGMETSSIKKKNNSIHYDYALERSLLLIILDIMGEVLSVDTAFASRIRTEMAGTNTATATTTLLQTILLDLGEIVDSLLARNQATTTTTSTSVRDFVMLKSEQRIITILVRVIANLCFQCRPHQNLMRTTLVPCTSTLRTTAAVASTPVTAASTTATETPRTGLHVLLSCTSFAHACFTLREWSIVAIRNALHENRDNQAVVADLEAQQPVQSVSLESMGIQIDLDQNSTNNNNSSSRHGSNY
jgi:Spinocerebellar ataxia type 10 protein domain